MAFDPAPSSWIASWSEDGTNVTFPLASISSLSAALADGTTGDWRSVLALILSHSFAYYDGLPSVDKPTKILLTSSFYIDSSGEMHRVISFDAILSYIATSSALPKAE